MSEELITETPMEGGEPQEIEAPRPDSLEAITATMKRQQEAMSYEELQPETESTLEQPGESQQLEREGDDSQQQEPGSEERSDVQSPLDKWRPIFGDNYSQETEVQLVDSLMASYVGLQTKPAETALSIIKQYIPKDQMQDFVTALSHDSGIDPFDLDIDSYAQTRPAPEVQEKDAVIQGLQQQMMALQVNQMKGSGDYPLLSDQSFVSQMAQVYGSYPDLGLEGAYRFVAAKNPDLAPPVEAVSEPAPQEPVTRRRLARKGDLLPTGKPNGSLYTDVPRNPVEHLRIKRSEMA